MLIRVLENLPSRVTTTGCLIQFEFGVGLGGEVSVLSMWFKSQRDRKFAHN